MNDFDGKLIVIDGVDASGKETQVEQLCIRLEAMGQTIKRLHFPCYESDSSALVKMYLAGELGKDPDKLDPYAISTLYAADRYVSFMTDWKKDLEAGHIIIADRYTTSNMIHQAAKLHTPEDKRKFLRWLEAFEYGIYGLPRPDKVLFLDMPVEYGAQLMAERKNKFTGKASKDIHEGNRQFMQESYENAMFVAKEYNWDIVNCVRDGKIRTIGNISDEIFYKAFALLQDRL